MSHEPEPRPPGLAESDHEARIAELAAGFAIGDLAEPELRELYDAIREPGERGEVAARLTWQQLGVVTDLRAGLGMMFQDAVRHRIDRAGMSDRFVRDSRQRLGSPRPALSEVASPKPARSMRWWPLTLLILGMLGVLVAVLMKGERPLVLCRVGAVVGEARLGGESLVTGMPIDHRQVVVPEGSRVTLTWANRSQVIIVGPADVVAQSEGVSLANGALWVVATASFIVGLPDDTAHIAAGGRFAVVVREGHSLFGVATGRVELSARTLSAGEAATDSAIFPWISYDAQSLPEKTEAISDWTLDTSARWRDMTQQIDLTVVDDSAHRGWHLVWHPGGVAVQLLGSTSPGRNLDIPGPPLSDTTLTMISSHGRFRIHAGGMSLMDEPFSGSSMLELPIAGRLPIIRLTYHTGPPLGPPAGSDQTAWSLTH